jgi:ABC-type polysaccharide/polyol phosphate export permease
MKNFSFKEISHIFVGFTALINSWLTTPFRFRTLFKGFVTQELQARYAGSMGGFIWYLLTPLSTLLMYIFIFSIIFQIRMKPIETGTDSFVVYLLAGLLPWMALITNSASDTPWSPLGITMFID